MKITRHPQNPIVVPGLFEWRKATVFNPAVIIENGKFYMIERAAGSLTPCKNYLGLLESDDGVNFKHVLNEPLITPDQLGYPYGSIQDPRIVKIENTFYLNYALRPCAMNYYPTGYGLPARSVPEYPDGWGKGPTDWLTHSGIMKSTDLLNWEFVSVTTPLEINDRDNILFPEKINNRFVLLRRPEEYVGEQYGTEKAAMWITYSDDLIHWDEPKLLAKAGSLAWEQKKIGGSTPPVKTEKGWLVLYHGVDEDSVYRVGALLLDLENPEIIIAKTNNFFMEPTPYYEKFGYQIPNVIFPTGNVVKDGILYIYYGVTDTAIALATVPLNDLVEYILNEN